MKRASTRAQPAVAPINSRDSKRTAPCPGALAPSPTNHFTLTFDLPFNRLEVKMNHMAEPNHPKFDGTEISVKNFS